MSTKIRYRLMMRKAHIDRLGRTLVVVEARIGKHKKHFGTGVYVRPDQWDGKDAPHPKLPTNPEANRRLRKIMAAAGIRKRVTVHTARHTFATNLLTKGVDLATISSLLSHTTTRMTQHYAETKDAKVVNDIKRVMNGR